MKLKDLFENASVGSTSAGSVAAVPHRFYDELPLKRKKQSKSEKKKIKIIKRIRHEVKS